MRWDVLDEHAQRMNVVVGSHVHSAFFSSLECLGASSLASLRARCLTGTECRLLDAYLDAQPRSVAEVFAFRGRVRHHLRRGKPHHHHHEIWLMLLLRWEQGPATLLPLRRDSDLRGLAVSMDREVSTEEAGGSCAASSASAEMDPGSPPWQGGGQAWVRLTASADVRDSAHEDRLTLSAALIEIGIRECDVR